LARAVTDGLVTRVEAALAAQAEAKSLAAAKQAADRRIATAEDPYSLQAAYRFLARNGGWEADADLGAQASPAAPLAQAQETALLLYRCRVFGGCGPNDLDTLTACAAMAACRPGFGLVDLLREIHSPAEFRLAEQIAARLLTRRDAASAQ
jgi:hypothetical protein